MLSQDEALSPLAELSRELWRLQSLPHEGVELFLAPNDSRTIGGQELRDDVAEVPSVRPEAGRHAIGGWLEHVLPAAAAEAAADKADRGGSPPGAEFADGVD